MEFYTSAGINLPPLLIQRNIHIANLADYCASIEKVLSCQGDKGEIYCVWGEFKVHRELIRQGVRFTLPGCPNALQWTITAAVDAPAKVQIHCSIDRPEHDEDFIESIRQFVEDWKQGLEAGKTSARQASSTAAADCLPVYG